MLNASRLEHQVALVERRMSKRFPIGLEVCYKTLSQRPEPLEGVGKTLNISSSGVLFTSEYELPVGTALEVSINWPVRLADGCLLNLVARGRVTGRRKGTWLCDFQQHEFRTQSRLATKRDQEIHMSWGGCRVIFNV